MPEPAAASVARRYAEKCLREGHTQITDHVCLDCFALALDAERARVWEEAARIADGIARLYAEKDTSGGPWPMDETLGAVACAVNIAAEIRARAAGGKRRGPCTCPDSVTTFEQFQSGEFPARHRSGCPQDGPA